MFNPTVLSESLFNAHAPGKRLSGIPASIAPTTIYEAYLVQAHLVSQLRQKFGDPVGYKVGCTNQTAREMLGVETPFYGRCFTKEIFNSPAIIDCSELHMVGIEPEIAVRIGKDMQKDTPWTAKQVIDLIEEVMPAIEIVESRFSTWPKMGILAAISDNGVHRKLILGQSITSWDERTISGARVELCLEEKIVRWGHIKNVDGGVFGVTAWLATQLNQKGLALKGGDIISTGVMTDIYDAVSGDNLIADYMDLGEVNLKLS
tara:strand:- start:145 stop:927 length:783 start_codon:yes stop_codon:yes gene_type:complete